MHERIQNDAKFEAGQGAAQAKVIVLEIAAAKLRVERAQFFQDGAAEHQAKTDQPGSFGGLPGVRGIPLGGEPGQFFQTRIIGRGNQLRAGHGIGDGASQAAIGIEEKGGRQVFQPAGCDDGVVIEQQDEVAAGAGQGLVVAGGKAQIGAVENDAGAAVFGGVGAEELARAVGRAIIDENQFVFNRGLFFNAGQTPLGVAELVVGQDDNGDQLAGRRLIPAHDR